MFAMLTARAHGVLRHSGGDAVLILLSVVYAALLVAMPSVALIAVGLWWTANTIAHNFIHTPFFRGRSLNRLYSSYLSALMGFPQELWRDRHLRHHRGDDRPIVFTTSGVWWFSKTRVSPKSRLVLIDPKHLRAGTPGDGGHITEVRTQNLTCSLSAASANVEINICSSSKVTACQ